MLIKKIKLENFKNFELLDVHLRNFNVIVGANASGKSNFILAIQFLRDIQNHGIENAISLQGGIENLQNFKINGTKNSLISVELKAINLISQTVEMYNSNIFCVPKSINYFLEFTSKKNKFELINEEIKLLGEIRERLYNTNSSVKQIHPVFFEKQIYTNTLEKQSIKIKEFSFSYFNEVSNFWQINDEVIIGKLSNEKNYQFTIHLGDAFGLSFHYSTKLDNYKKLLLETYPLFNCSIYDFDSSIKHPTSILSKVELEENGKNISLVIKNILSDKEKKNTLLNLLNDILPFIKDLQTEKQNKTISFKVKEDFNSKTFVPSSFLSDGTVSVISILIALIFERKSVKIFEEPERGIHPAIISKLMQLFYESADKKQIIITTHNPEIVKHSKIEDLLLISRAETGFAKISRPNEKNMVKNFLENECYFNKKNNTQLY